MKASFAFEPMPHEEAAGYIQDRSPMKREHFDRLRPELKARAFVVTGIEDLNVVRAIRDAIAEVPRGGDWEEAKAKVEAELAPWIHEDQVETRAKILLRYHVFQAYGAAHHQDMMQDKDVFTHWQYRSSNDDKVRSSHAALDGLVLPAGHAFWEDHFPPWEYNCRCEVLPLLPEEVEAIRAEDANRDPAKRLVLEGPMLKQLEEQGQLHRGPNEIYDVKSARAKATNRDAVEKAFRNDPGDFTIPLDVVRKKTNPEDWWFFRDWAMEARVDEKETVWSWLIKGEENRAARELRGMNSRMGVEKAILLREGDGERLDNLGKSDTVHVGGILKDAEAKGGKWIGLHNHPEGGPPSPADLRSFVESHHLSRMVIVNPDGSRILIERVAGARPLSAKAAMELEMELKAVLKDQGLDGLVAATRRLGEKHGFRVRLEA